MATHTTAVKFIKIDVSYLSICVPNLHFSRFVLNDLTTGGNDKIEANICTGEEMEGSWQGG